MGDWIYNNAKVFITDGVINLETDTFNLMLVGSNYTPNSGDTHANSVAVCQTSGTSYSSGGVVIANPTTTLSGGVVKWDADDAVWSGATFSANYGIIMSATASGWPLVCGLDFGSGTKSVAGGTFTVQFNAAGILNLT
jgi:hypothetical protein